MLPLRTKFTLSLLAISLAAIGCFYLVARWKLESLYSEEIRKESFARFVNDIEEYLTYYGSWDAAVAAEPFHEFQHRRQLAMFESSYRSQGRENESQEQTGDAAPSGRNGPPDNSRGFPPPPPRGERPPMPSDGGHPPRPPPFFNGPPFLFMVLDLDGRVLLGPREYPIGSLADESLRRDARPIERHGKTAVLAVPLKLANRTPADLRYLDMVGDSLAYAVVAASVLAAGLGTYVGNRFSRRIRRLTEAIKAMGAGKLRQSIKVRSSDELGALVEAFNRMSGDLAQAHEELTTSAEKIRQQADQLAELAIRDELTKLFNRRYFDDHGARALAQARRYGRPLVIAVGDIDHFKRINDTFSHAIGDEVLRQLAQIFRNNTRQSDIVARYGGEEFVICFPETDLEKAHLLCEKLRKLIESHPWSEIHPALNTSISIGLAADDGASTFEALIAAADVHLYRAKDQGRNRVSSDHAADVVAS